MKKLTLDQIKVRSFITQFDVSSSRTVKGGLPVSNDNIRCPDGYGSYEDFGCSGDVCRITERCDSKACISTPYNGCTKDIPCIDPGGDGIGI